MKPVPKTPAPEGERSVIFRMTPRIAYKVATLFLRERRKRMRMFETTDFVPMEGKLDANAVVINIMDDLIGQIENQLPERERRLGGEK